MTDTAAADPAVIDHGRRLLGSTGTLVVLSGAGMSADSGVPTFRDAQVGLWERFDPAQLATPQAWRDDPATVWAWYRWREHLVARARPNAGHLAVASAQTGRRVVVVTQNVDDLHERAGSRTVHHLHGSLFAHRCSRCDHPVEVGPPPGSTVDRLAPPACPLCGADVRPGVVWFGEALPEEPWDAAVAALGEAAAVLVVGTSGLVQPAASLPGLAARAGIPVVEVNPGPSGSDGGVDLHIGAPAAIALPALLSAGEA